ncbi:hypothetical protein N9924_01260 [bacterium]|nr:hypothetical protein [bacterium]
MKEYESEVPFDLGPTEQFFKVKIGTGTASVQIQAINEGFDEMEDGAFSSTGFGIIHLGECKGQVVLTGDARFFMGIHNNRR